MTKNRKLGCGCAAFCIVILLALGAYLVIGRPAAMVRGEIARIAREGGPVTLKDLDGPRIADSQNGAVVYQKAFALISGKAAGNDINYISRATATIDPLKTPAEWSRLKKIIAKYEAVIPIVEAAQARPDCWFSVKFKKSKLFAALCAHDIRPVMSMHRLSRLLCAQAIVYAQDGRTDESLRCLELGFGLNKSLEHRPNLIEYLTRIGMVNTGASALRKILAHGSLNNKQARHLSNTLSKIELSDGLKEALEVERVMFVSHFDDMRKVDPHFVAYASKNTKKLGLVVSVWIQRMYCYSDELYFLRHMRDYIDASKLTYLDAVKSHRQLEDLSSYPKYALLSSMMLSCYERTSATRDRAQVRINGSRIALALAVYKNDNKTYPAKLSDISKFFGGKIPIDLFSGKDFIYRQQGKGYLLYSIGANLKDDGGKEPAPRKSNQEFGDIVWKVE